jgi:hypothetical protein
VREVGGSHLGFDDGASEQTFAPNDVLIEQLNHNVLDVGDVHLIDNPIDAAAQ